MQGRGRCLDAGGQRYDCLVTLASIALEDCRDSCRDIAACLAIEFDAAADAAVDSAITSAERFAASATGCCSSARARAMPTGRTRSTYRTTRPRSARSPRAVKSAALHRTSPSPR